MAPSLNMFKRILKTIKMGSLSHRIFYIRNNLVFRIFVAFVLCLVIPQLARGFQSHLMIGSTLQAESLWKDKDPYSYPKTIQPGTVVKVVLKNGLRVEYESEYKATFDNDIKTVPDKKLVPDLPNYTANATYMRSKVGKSKSQGKVVGVMAVLVTGIDPGTGNLELEGSRVFNLSEERINLRLSGTISPEDLDKNRFIASDLIANLRVEYQGTLNPKELNDPNIQMKRITNPDGTVTEKAEISDKEKQEIILKNIKRLLGESE